MVFLLRSEQLFGGKFTHLTTKPSSFDPFQRTWGKNQNQNKYWHSFFYDDLLLFINLNLHPEISQFIQVIYLLSQRTSYC